MTLLLAAVGATVAALLELTAGHTSGSDTAEPHLVLVSRGHRHRGDRSRGRARLGLRGGPCPRCPTPTAARFDGIRAAVVCRLPPLRSASSSRGFGHSSRSSPPSLLESRLLHDPVHRVQRAPNADPGRPTRSPGSCPARSTTSSWRRCSGRWSSRSTTVGPRPNGSTGDGLPRRASPPDPVGLAVRDFRSGRRIGRDGASPARLFYLQVVDGGRLATLSVQQRTVEEAIPAPRGLIYDRNGRLLVTNIATFVVKLRPADLPIDQRPEVVARLAALLRTNVADINAKIDGNPGSTFDFVRIATDVDENTARLISEAGFDLPGVEVAVEARRQYAQGPLLSQILGLHRASQRRPTQGPQGRRATCRTTSSARPASSRSTRPSCVACTAPRCVERDASGRKTQVLQTLDRAAAGRLAEPDHRHEGTAVRAEGAALGDEQGRHQARRRHRDEPADRRGPRPRQPARPTTTTTSHAGSATPTTRSSSRTPTSRCSTTPSRRHYPPGSTYKLVAGTGALADQQDHRHDEGPDRRATSILGSTKFYDWNQQRLRRLRHLLRVRPLERHLLLPDGGQARHRPPRLLGAAVRLRLADRHRPARRGRRHRPDQPMEGGRARAHRSSRARRTRPGSARAMTW